LGVWDRNVSAGTIQVILEIRLVTAIIRIHCTTIIVNLRFTLARFVTSESCGIAAVIVTESQSLILANAVDICRIDITTPTRAQRISTIGRILRSTIALVITLPIRLVTAI
jgi:hypothetical protein